MPTYDSSLPLFTSMLRFAHHESKPHWTCFSNRALQEQVSGHKFAWVRCGSTLPNLLEQQSTTRASIRPQARMRSVWFDLTKPAWATDHNKSKYQATSWHEFGVVQTTRSHLVCSQWIRPQACMSLMWFDPTEPAWSTEHYKSKYQLKWVRCGSPLPNLLGQQSTTRTSFKLCS